MAKKQDAIYVAPPKESREWLRVEDLDVIAKAWHDYDGAVDVFESAVGALLVGRLCGYDALRVVHSWKTLRNYERILGVAFKDVLQAQTKDSRRVNGIRYAEKFQAFWKAIAAGVGSEPAARDVVAE